MASAVITASVLNRPERPLAVDNWPGSALETAATEVLNGTTGEFGATKFGGICTMMGGSCVKIVSPGA